MKLSISLKFLRGMGMAIGLGAMSQAQAPRPTFSIAISSPGTTKLGQPMMVEITVTNVSDHVIAFDTDEPSRGERDFQVQVLDSRGNPPSETNYMKSVRGEDQGPGPTHIVFTGRFVQRELKPGESTKGSLNLAVLFYLKADAYTVTLSRGDFMMGHDRVLDNEEDAKARSQQRVYREPELMKPKAIAASNTIKIKVTE